MASPTGRIDPPKTAEAVASAVRKRLRQSGYPQLAAIECIAEGDEIVLVGEVTTFYLMQVAQTLTKQVGGIEKIDNRLTVQGRENH